MRKKILISISILPVILGLMFVSAHIVSAETTTTSGQTSSYIGGIATDAIATGLSYVSNLALHVMSLWLALTGALLNVSIAMTMHIKDFVDSTQGVYLVWQTIRDISGLFMIFMLLYASFKIILGFDSVGGVGTLIKNIVIVGILINFSFFITSLLIDASNIVSLALYNGIVGETTTTQTTSTNCPTTKNGQQTGSLNTCTIVSEMYTGNQSGISAIFLNFLSPQLIYNGYNSSLSSNTNTTDSTSADGSSSPSPFKIIIQGIVGCIIMFTSGLSFLLASVAFMVRLIILIFLLAFSPIWFASWVIPGLDDKAKEFTNQLKAQLIFMPVYLLLLYAALRFLSMSTVFTNPSGNVFSGSTSDLSSLIPVNYIVLAVNDFFIIFMLNLPLVVAFSMGGVATKLINSDRFNASAIWKKAGMSAGSFAGRRTLGRAAYALNESATMKKINAFSPTFGGFASKQVGKVANLGFGTKKGGYKDMLDAKRKAQKDMYESIGNIDRSKYSSEAEYQAAKAAAKKMQVEYAENLEHSSGIMKFMLDNRANRQSAFEMTDAKRTDAFVEQRRINEETKKSLEERKAGGRMLTREEIDLLKHIESENVRLDQEIKAAGERKNSSQSKAEIAKLIKGLKAEMGDDTKPATPKDDTKK